MERTCPISRQSGKLGDRGRRKKDDVLEKPPPLLLLASPIYPCSLHRESLSKQ